MWVLIVKFHQLTNAQLLMNTQGQSVWTQICASMGYKFVQLAHVAEAP